MALTADRFDESVKESGDAPDIVQLYSDAVAAEMGGSRPSDGFIHCSSLGSKDWRCEKQLQFERLGTAPSAKKNLPQGLGWSLLRGKMVHDALDSIAKNIPHPVENKVYYLSRALGLAGETDRVIRVDKVPWIIDDKTCSPMTFKFLGRAKEENVYQMHGYMLLTGIPRAILVYIPTGKPENDDPLSLVKRAMRVAPKGTTIANRLAQLLTELDQSEMMILSSAAAKTAWGSGVSGRQFVVYQDEAVIADILDTLDRVAKANEADTWLPKNMGRCTFCGHVEPCFRGDTVASVKEKLNGTGTSN